MFHVALVFSLAFCSTMYHFLQLGMDHEVKKAARATCNCLRFSGFSRAKLLREPEVPKGGFSRIRSDSARELCAISVHTEKSQLQIPSPTPGKMAIWEYPVAWVKFLCTLDVGLLATHGVFCGVCFGVKVNAPRRTCATHVFIQRHVVSTKPTLLGLRRASQHVA